LARVRLAWSWNNRERLNSKRFSMTDLHRLKKTKFSNVYATPTGGHFVRARATDPSTNQTIQIRKTLQTTDPLEAFQWLTKEIERIKSGVALEKPAQLRFCDFAVQLLEDKRTSGDIKSAAGNTRWVSTLQHLIAGTTGESSEAYVSGFGEIFIEKLHVSHVELWKLGIARLIKAGDYAPTTANGWLSILRVICKAAKRKFSLTCCATDDVPDFDTSDWITYSEEEPNSLLPEQVPLFLERLRQLYPQHYAMAFLGFATGLRPSSLRPLRRRGPEVDTQWDKNRILIRRSQTRGPEVMQMTKQRTRYAIDLPQSVMDVLKWHVEHQLRTPEQQDSDLLFPSATGGYRAPTVLNKPFEEIATELCLPAFTQRGMRRTYNDLARRAGVIDLVTRSISGHSTEQMQHHYSTVSAEEQRASIGKVIQLFKVGGPLKPGVDPLEDPSLPSEDPFAKKPVESAL
jgi:integrase